MRRLIYFVVALIIWIVGAWPFVDGGIDPQMSIAGVIAAAIVAVLFHEILPKEHHVLTSPVRIFWALVYLPVFFYYVIVANLDVVYRALHPKMHRAL
jgi:multicomponent Na+:H+ antiporter subunit E